MARAIVRYSFDGPPRGTRSQVRDVLRAADYHELGTASFEARDARLEDLVQALREVLDIVSKPAADVKLDHLWIYLDEPSEPN